MTDVTRRLARKMMPDYGEDYFSPAGQDAQEVVSTDARQFSSVPAPYEADRNAGMAEKYMPSGMVEFGKSVKAARGKPSLFGKALGAIGLDESGRRAQTSWGDAAKATMWLPGELVDGLIGSAKNVAQYDGGSYLTSPDAADRSRAAQYAGDVFNVAGALPAGGAVAGRMAPKEVAAFSNSKEASLPGLLSHGGDKGLPMDTASRMQRAREMGFDTDKTWYHGTGGELRGGGFDPAMGGDLNPNPLSKEGHFLSAHPDIAGTYAEGAEMFRDRGGANIIPAHINPGKQKVIDFNGYDNAVHTMWESVKPAKDAGYDSVVLRNQWNGNGMGVRGAATDPKGIDHLTVFHSDERGRPTPMGLYRDVKDQIAARPMEDFFVAPDEIVVFDPKNIRSKFAAFDPAKRDSANLLASNPEEAAPLSLLSQGKDTKQGITAYHGSPHDFDAFSMDKIGTGEGAQAFGHGLYFAEAEDVAKTYKAAGNPSYQDVGVVRRINEALRETGGDERAARELLNTKALAANGQERQQLFDAYNNFREAREPGHLYEVRINADPESFLDWDKPLSQQPQAVTEKLREVVRPSDRMPKEWIDHSPGAESRLRDAGIPGIRYLDQGSRTAGEGSRNYVVFDDKIIDIIRKYGWAAAAPLIAAMQQGEAKAEDEPVNRRIARRLMQ